MELTLKVVLWVCLGSVVYNYVGYPFLLFVLAGVAQAKSYLVYLLRRRDRRCEPQEEFQPLVALLFSAYNEEVVIEAKVKNCLEIEYPPDRLEILIGLDAPADSTPEVLSHIPSSGVRVFHFVSRRGKLAVLIDLAQRTSAEILVFSDANTMFDRHCVQNLVRHFADPRVGAVSGEEVRLSVNETEGSAESLYWRYESAIKILESRLNCSLVVNGSVHAVRRSLFNPRTHLMAEDLHLPMDIRYGGHRVVYDPEAIVTEDLPSAAGAQFERRARIAAHSFQTFFGAPAYLNPFKGLPTFAYFSHKVLRWFAPLLLLLAFFANVWLAREPFFGSLLAAQFAFYSMAAFGYWRKRQGKSAGPCAAAYYLTAVNLLLLVGLFRYLSGHQLETWKVTPRDIESEYVSVRGGIEKRAPSKETQ